MTLSEKIARQFEENEWTWNTTEGPIVPNATDILKTLDRAAELLYDEQPGTLMEVGRLVIQKQPRGFDVYVHAGFYE